MTTKRTVLVTGGGGYVGAVLVPRLLAESYRVRVLDLYIYGREVLDPCKAHPDLEQIQGDVRDQRLLQEIMPGIDAVVHLACISNDPSFELNPELGRSINFDAFEPLVRISKASGVQRFIYASSSSVYGVSEAPEVTEDHPLVPITDYNRYKALCEPILLEQESPDFVPVVIRPATICGYSLRQRFDLTVNILTNHAVNTGKITVFGGSQKRPNLHIEDMVDLYVQVLEEHPERVSGKVYNVGYQNFTVREIAERVRSVVKSELRNSGDLEIVITPSEDIRSYHISSKRIREDLGFEPKRTIEDAVRELCQAFSAGLFPNSMTNKRYFNIRRMQEVRLR